MSYGLIYTIPFASLRNEACVVEIEKEGYTGASVELTAAGSPFSVEIGDEEFLYAPTRFSTANIRIVGSDYLQRLFSTSYQQHRVTFKKGGVVTWCGFIKPELYTQDYSSGTFTLELECMSAMSTLEYIDYKQRGTGTRAFVSLWDLLKDCVTCANGLYEAVYIPHVYAASPSDYASGVNVLENMTLSEQDFFDEDDKPMTLKEVLEEVCKFLNWTCVDWRGSLYFVDIDHTGEYYKYDSSLEEKIGETRPELLGVEEIGYAGNDNKYDILPGYNKVTVKTSNYPVGAVFPEEDFDKLKRFGVDYSLNKNNHVTLKRFYLPEVYKLHRYKKNNDVPLPDEELNSYKDRPNDVIGAMLMKRCEYNIVNGEPDITNYDWEEIIQVRSYLEKGYQIGGVPILEFANPLPVAPYSDGGIAISLSLQVTMNVDMTVGYVKQTGWLAMYCQLAIGDMYYDWESGWVKNPKARFPIEFYLNNYDGSSFVNNINTKKLSMPYNGLSGYIIPLPDDKPLFGSIKFCISELGRNSMHQLEHGDNRAANDGYGYFIKNLKMEYKRRDDLDNLESNSDRYYENVANESYINELDEIEFKISSYNNDGTCYSKVLLGDGYLTDNLYSSIEDAAVRPEEQLIRRIIKRYGVTRIKLTQVIQETSGLNPLTRLSDTYLVGKRFLNAGGSIDYQMGQFTCIMIEV